MRRDEIKEVLRDVLGRQYQLSDLSGWVGMRCPLAQWTHERGTDKTPSAGVSVNEDGASGFNCFTCGHHTAGPFSRMLEQYAEFTGEDLSELIDEVEEGEFLGPRTANSYDSLLGRDDEGAIAMPIEEGLHMDLYDSAAGHPYLLKRGISRKTARKLELLYDPKDPADKEPRILFPVRGPDGSLFGFSGRATRPTAKLKVRDYFGLAKSQVVLGSHFGESADRIVVVEGLVDYASSHEYGEAGCAVMHGSMTEAQARIIRELGKPTYLMYDKDDAGRDGTAIARKLLLKHVPLFGTKYPQVKVQDDSEQGWHWLKDPGEMLEEEFLAMLDKAHLL